MLKTLAPALAIAATAGLLAPAFAQDAGSPSEAAAAAGVSIDGAVEAATTAGLVEVLTSGEPVTVFVPTDDALAGAPEEALAEVTGDPERLSQVIQGYAIPGTVRAADAIALATEAGGSVAVDSLAGTPLTIMVEGDQVMIQGQGETMGTVVAPDLEFGNVLIHVVDGAILPN